MHKIYYDKCPSYLKEHFIPVSVQHNYNSRNSKGNFFIPQVDSFTKNTFYYNAIKDWNMLPADIKDVKNKNLFKKKVKFHLTDNMRTVNAAEYVYY